MSQNSMKLRWEADEVDEKLKAIMANIHEACIREGRREDGYVDYARGANIAGFKKVADTMIELGY
jgi:glutamate dehydrogenase (NADP+)